MKSICKSIEKLKNGTATIGKKLLCTSIPLSILLSNMGITSFAVPVPNIEDYPYNLMPNSDNGEGLDRVYTLEETLFSLPSEGQGNLLLNNRYYLLQSVREMKFIVEEEEQNLLNKIYDLLPKLYEECMDDEVKGLLDKANNDLLQFLQLLEQTQYGECVEDELLIKIMNLAQHLKCVSAEKFALNRIDFILQNIQRMECMGTEKANLLTQIDFMLKNLHPLEYMEAQGQKNIWNFVMEVEALGETYIKYI